MADIVAPILETLNTYPGLAGLVTFLISAGESVAILGTIVPGSITMTAIGALAGAGIIPLWETLFWAILGAIVGDGISYWIGHYFKDRLPNLWPFRNHPGMLRVGEIFFHKHGSMSVFIGRFVGPVRALVPVIAGMLGMRPLKFYLANIASAILWAPAYMLPGILVGAASLELPPDIALHVIMVLILLSLFISLCLWFAYKFLQLVHNQTNEFQAWLWQKLQRSSYFSKLTVILQHHDQVKTVGQLTLAFYFVGYSLLFLFLIALVKMKSAANVGMNDVVFHLFRGIRTEHADSIMINLTMLGQKHVVLPAVLVVVVSLIISKRWWTALHALALGVLAAGAVFVTKHLIHSQRPWGIVDNPDSYSMPSGHTTLATTVYLGLAFLIALSMKPSRRWIIFSVAGLLAFLVGVSRLYLGAHWFTDVLSGWVLSAAVLSVIIISFRRHLEKPVNPLFLIVVSLVSLTITYTAYHHYHFSSLEKRYTQLSLPIENLSMQEWWQKNNAIPAYRASLFGFPSIKINVEWVGGFAAIQDTLAKEGWVEPPKRNWISTLHRIADVSSTQYLPMVSPQYLDKKPALTLVREVTDETDKKRMLVLRLWNANRLITETDDTLWVGTLSIVPRTYSWIFKRRAGEIDIDPMLVFPIKAASANWQWKLIVMDLPTGTKKTISQKIMLIRQNKTIHQKSNRN